MIRQRIVVESAGNAFVQDLGRPGYASIGVSPNGASDQHAARTANVLVGNADFASLVEVTGSEFSVRCESPALVAATGAAGALMIDGNAHPTWELVAVPAGASLRVPTPAWGVRSYLAFNGTIRAPVVLGSVAPDRHLGVGAALSDGDELCLESSYVAPPSHDLAFFRLGAQRPVVPIDGIATIDVILGPDLHRLTGGAADLDATFQVQPESDHVGLRLDGPPITAGASSETLSRGVPVGAVQVPHSGGLIVLLRGRLVTAGYPIVAVATTASLDTLGQLRPGDRLRFQPCSIDDAVAKLRALVAQRRALADRVRAALTARDQSFVLRTPTPDKL